MDLIEVGIEIVGRNTMGASCVICVSRVVVRRCWCGVICGRSNGSIICVLLLLDAASFTFVIAGASLCRCSSAFRAIGCALIA
jgi:hypothetical protein